MLFRLRRLWQPLRESLWFVPLLMVLASLGLAYGLIRYDQRVGGGQRLPLLFGIDPAGAGGMLTAVAGSMLTVAALTFSLLLAAIAQVSNQYSPRALRNFMRDPVNQVTMGYFVSVFTFGLLVQGTIRSGRADRFVPTTAVLAGLLLALGGVAALIFFIHHIAEALQTGTLVRRIMAETERELRRLFPLGFGLEVEAAHRATAEAFVAAPEGWFPVVAPAPGYLQYVDTQGLLAWTTRHRTVLRLEVHIGDFVGTGQALLSVRAGMERAAPAQADWPADLLRYVGLGPHRNPEQDVAFGVQQLVDIALKALSPAVNDTTTAIMAIDYLGELVGRLARRDFPGALRSDGQHLRVLVRAYDFVAYVRLAFDLVRQSAGGNPAVLRRLLRALALAASQVRDPARLPVLRQQVQLLLETARASLPTAYARQEVQAVYAELCAPWMGEAGPAAALLLG
ncbi:DUF2254 domain-containing protein [Hymenobacter sp. RP-2-7]|uniref:DUF2254 domain-containing protein n=1 Tax=Hymenobacter polaris TaxID=2682546 RepID=A0A7Y0AAC5_9BACT|nr:DUF2254 domain-containing protein [Hymenobacter polaris]NML63678.1 DUF2254 domain-containing protein [Hymenobacter polaris]